MCGFQRPCDITAARQLGTATVQQEIKKAKAPTAAVNCRDPNADVNRKQAPQEPQSGNKRKHPPNEVAHAQPHSKQLKRDHEATDQSPSNDVALQTSSATKANVYKRLPGNSYPPSLPQPTTTELKAYSNPDVPSPHAEFASSDPLDTGDTDHKQEAPIVEYMDEPPPRDDDDDSNKDVGPQILLKMFMNDVGLDPAQPETATIVMHAANLNEDIILTVTAKECGFISLYNTHIPRSHKDYDGSRVSRSSTIKPYLKEGQHGRGGQFDNDPDRSTGRGHDYEPEDTRNFHDYLAIEAALHKKYPKWPYKPDGECVDPEIIEIRNAQRTWYNGYARKYSGRLLRDWPCGCEKLVAQDDAESESEE